MKRRWVILIALAAVLVGGIVVTLVAFHEPSYDGRRITAWLDDFIASYPFAASRRTASPSLQTAKTQEQNQQAREAILKIGSDGIPFILARVGMAESGWRKKYAELRPKLPGWLQHVLPLPREPLDPNSASGLLTALGPRTIQPCIDALKDSTPLVRATAAETMMNFAQGTNPPLDAIPALTVAAGDGDVRVRLYAAGALGGFGPAAAAAVPALTAALQGSDAGPKPGDRTYARGWAVIALGRIGPVAKSAVPALRPFLQDTDAFLRCESAVAIWRIDGDVENTLPVLVAELSKSDPNMKWQWIEALGEMGPRATNAFPVLVNELNQPQSDRRSPTRTSTAPDQYTREKITNALMKIDPDAAAKILR